MAGRVDTLRLAVHRLLAGVLALAFVVALASQLLPSVADAGQVTTRSITMSSSTPSATATTYTVNFTPATNETHPDIIIDFCNSSSDPIPGDTCSGTAGTDVPNFSTAPTATGWTVTSVNSNKSLKLTTSTLSFTAGTAITPIVLSGITNMSNAAGFYARILVYANGGSSTYSSPTSPGSYVDYGGIALSTASNISITSKVFETLVFCVFQSSCGTAPTLTLGASGTGALSTTTQYVNNSAQYTIATNAGTGVNVVMTGTTLCKSSTLTNCQPGGSYAANTIAALGSTAVTTAAGSSQFGMCVDSSALPSGVTVAATYKDTSTVNCHGLTTGTYAPSTASLFGFNDATTTGGTNNAAGSTVLSSTGSIASYTGTLTFVGNISTTTNAGLYTTSLNMVATGTF